MRLVIDNLAKVRHADFVFNGITVIAGNNDTGKSTVGKALFAMFTIFKDIEDRIKTLRFSKVLALVDEFDRRSSILIPVLIRQSFRDRFLVVAKH